MTDTKERIALFTGSFDPLTKGHLDIIVRASKLFDRLYLGVFENHEKKSLFTLEERLKMIEPHLQELENVELISHRRDLTVNIAAELGAQALVRSARNIYDFDYEANMSYFNHEMTGIETILLLAKPELGMISSTRIRELAAYGQDLSKYLPENVAKELREKFGK